MTAEGWAGVLASETRQRRTQGQTQESPALRPGFLSASSATFLVSLTDTLSVHPWAYQPSWLVWHPCLGVCP